MDNKVVIGSDHGAVELKERIRDYLKQKGYEVIDVGVESAETADYPDIASLACREFLDGGCSFGILCCGTGIGISIAANKIDGIRCALIHDLFTAEMSKAHNNANFIALGGRVTYSVPVEKMIDRYIETAYEGGRHERRLLKIAALE